MKEATSYRRCAFAAFTLVELPFGKLRVVSKRKRMAFTLVELLVVIAIIGTLMGLLLPAVQNARESGRSNACRSNLANLQKAMSTYEVSNKQFPGYIEPAGVLTRVKATWAAMMLPYIERADLWDEFSKGKPTYAAVEIYICPSNPSSFDGAPSMSYLANAGYVGRDGEDIKLKENVANGVFFDRVRATKDMPESVMDVRDLDYCPEPKWCPDAIFKQTFAYVQAEGDGSTNTLMFAEGLNAVHWGYVGGDAPDKKWYFGFCWEQPANLVAGGSTDDPDRATSVRYRVINGLREKLPLSSVGEKKLKPNTGFPSSNHPGGVNVAFIGGQVQFMSERISPVVYAQLMTSSRKGSDLEFEGKQERELSLPDSDDY
jgi:prepilin-type N-terminal cleavage/methylation domain-containing protein/prepilin-type processing-associated H-X9-DG protein